MVKKEKSLVELTEDEFINSIFSCIDKYDDQISKYQKLQQQAYKLYRNYLLDKDKYNLTFSLQDNMLTYCKKIKQEIGYKRLNQNEQRTQ